MNRSPNADTPSAPSLAAPSPPPPPGAFWALVLCVLSAATGCGAYLLSRSATHGLFTACAWLGWFVLALAVSWAAHRWDCAAPRGSWRVSGDAARRPS